MKREAKPRELDGGLLIFGMVLGLIVGGLAALFGAPNSGAAFRHRIVSETGQNLRSTIEAVVPSDPLAESMAEGKAAVRRRLAELGESGKT